MITGAAIALTLAHNGNATFAGDVGLADGKKLTFGASDDLEIYHDGNNSKITEGGTGGLYIGSNLLGIESGDHSETMAKFTADGSVDLYHNNVKKFETTSAGVTVTGNVTVGGGQILTPSGVNLALNPNTGVVSVGGVIRASGTGNSYFTGNLGIGTTSPSVLLDARLSGTTGKVAEFHNSVGYGIGFTVGTDAGVNTINSETNQALAFATNGASNERMRITISGNVGIGTTAPNGKLEVQRSQITTQLDTSSFLRLHPSATTNSGGYTNMIFGTDTANNYGVVIGGKRAGTNGEPSFSMRMLNDSITGTEVLNISNSGNATFSGNVNVNINASGNNVISTFKNANTTSGNRSAIKVEQQVNATGSFSAFLGSTIDGKVFLSNDSITANHLIIDTSGNVGIGTATPSSLSSNTFNLSLNSTRADLSSALFLQSNGSTKASLYWDTAGLNIQTSSGDTKFTAGGSERMRIESGGDVGIGTTNPGATLQIGGGTASVLQKIHGAVTAGIQIFTGGGAGTKIASLEQYFSNEGSLFLFLSGTTKILLRASGDSYLNGGKVGIGTTAPLFKFQVEGTPPATNGALINIRNSAATTTNTTFGGIYFNSAPGNDFSIGKSNVNSVTTLSFRNGNTGASLIDVSPSGNVGIGTTTPAVKLDVVGSSNGAAIRVAGLNTDSAAHYYGFMHDPIDLQGTTQVNTFYSGGAIKASTTITDYAGIRIDTPSVSADGAAVTNNYGVYQSSSLQKNYFAGKIGIGTSSPAANLDVVVSNVSVTPNGNSSAVNLDKMQTIILQY